MPFKEFVCRSGGSNLNGGALASDAEPATASVYSTTNGNWDGTSVFTPTDGSTPASTVTVGDYASVFVDGATVGVYVAKVTAVAAGVNGAVTLSTSAKAGTAPTSSATARSIRVGGAWKGPNAAEMFPFNLSFLSALTGATGNVLPRVNMKNDAVYSITASINCPTGAVSSTAIQGYTTTFGDGGKAVIDGGTSGASYTLFSFANSTTSVVLDSIEFRNNGATGAATGVVFSGGNTNGVISRCVIHDVRGSGLGTARGTVAIECEVYNCNQSGTANAVGIGGDRLIRCFSHDNSGSSTHGFLMTLNVESSLMIGCVADSNGGSGLWLQGAGSSQNGYVGNCDFYNNGGDGIRVGNSSTSWSVTIESCNFVKNGGYGVNYFAGNVPTGFVRNCGFGSGTQANTSGQTSASLGGIVVSGSVTYASNLTPWVDPANGDFRILLAAAKGAGRGAFTQTATSYAGTLAYPDIGAAQSLGQTPTFGRAGPLFKGAH